MCQRTNCEMDFLDVLQWVRVVCDAPSAMGDFVRRGGARGNMLRWIWMRTMEYILRYSVTRNRTPCYDSFVVWWDGLRDERVGDPFAVEEGGQEVGRGFGDVKQLDDTCDV